MLSLLCSDGHLPKRDPLGDIFGRDGVGGDGMGSSLEVLDPCADVQVLNRIGGPMVSGIVLFGDSS